MQTREFKVAVQTDIVALLFILASVYFASGSIFARFGTVAGYVYCIVGIILIVMQFVRLMAYYRAPRA